MDAATIRRVLRRRWSSFNLATAGAGVTDCARRGAVRGSSDEMRALVDLWFAEEREHSRLLSCAVRRFGGRLIQSHWSFSAFCATRRVLGVWFELQVLLLTEIVSTCYYRVLRRASVMPRCARCTR